MADAKNKLAFQQLEYVMDNYFSRNIAPIVKGQQEYLHRRQVEETRTNTSDGGWGGYIDAASPFTTTNVFSHSGEWNKKSSDDLIRMIQEKIGGNKTLQHDLQTMTDVWRATAVRELGVARYKELSAQCPSGDLAADFVSNRFMNNIMEQLAKTNIPHSSLEYILRKGLGESLPGYLAGAMWPRGGDTDKKLIQMSEKLYNPSVAERGGAAAVSMLGDVLTTGGYGKGLKAAAWMSADVVSRIGLSYADGETNFDEYVGKQMFGDSNAFSRYREAGKKGQIGNTEVISIINDCLTKKVKIPYSNEQQKKYNQQILSAIGTDGSALIANAKNIYKVHGIKANEKTSIPDWMMKKSKQECLTYGSYFVSLAVTMQQSGTKFIKMGDKKLSYQEVVQRGYDYSRAADKKQQQEVTQQKKAAVKAAPAQEQPVQAQSVQGQYGAGIGYPGRMQTAQQGMDYSQMGMSSWGGLFNQLGLGGITDLGKNFGYVLAMLPDMLIGMLTGQTRNLHLKDNLLPFGAIFAGLFVKNPLLKMLLIGLGGANILNKAGHEVLENAGIDASKSRQPQQKRYKHYADEELSPRITQPAMKGNALVASIDGNPCVIYIDEQTADAYYKDKLPLNVLCNAVLQKYDEQQAQVRQNYDRGVRENDAVQQSRGIK